MAVRTSRPTLAELMAQSGSRAMRRRYVRRAWQAHRYNTRSTITLQEAWRSWNPADCGPLTWTRILERNGICCRS